MSYPPSCCECPAKTLIIWDAKPWCREHFHQTQDRAKPAEPATEEPARG